MPGLLEREDRYETLDDCINDSYAADLCSIASIVRGHNRNKRVKVAHLRPVAFVRFNTSLGKPKPVTIRALVDSGAAGTMVTKEFVKKLRMKKDPEGETTWSTPAGPMKTNQKVKCQFTIPELQEDKLIEWDCHVLPSLGANCDMILGRDFLEFAGIDVRFSTQVIEWVRSSRSRTGRRCLRLRTGYCVP